MSRRLLRYLDWPVLAATCILVAGGAVVLYSAVQNSGDAGALVRARALHAIFGLVVLTLAAFIDYQTIARAWRPILGTTLFLLVAVLLVGRRSMGGQRWIPATRSSNPRSRSDRARCLARACCTARRTSCISSPSSTRISFSP